MKLRSYIIRLRPNPRIKATVHHTPSASADVKREVVVDHDKQREVDPKVMDIILDKVAQSGYNSLTQTEKEQLFHAGQ